MQLTVGPYDPALHIRTRDYYQAVLRETKLLTLQHDTPSLRLEALGARLQQQFPPGQVEETADRAYRAGEATFTATVELPDQLVPAAITAGDQLNALLDELDRWAADPEVQLLPARQRSAPTTSATWPRSASNYTRLTRQAGRCHRPNDDLSYAKPSGLDPSLPQPRSELVGRYKGVEGEIQVEPASETNREGSTFHSQD